MDFSQYNIKFKLFGIPICIMPSFWILCIFFSPFMSMKTDADRPWLCGVAGWIMALLLSFLIHELGHALTARKFFRVSPDIAFGVGRSPDGASVFGGVTTWRRSETTHATSKRRALVSAAGPCAALAAAILALGVAFLTGARSFSYHLEFGVLPVVYPHEWVVKTGEVGAADLFLGYFSLGFFWINFFWSVVNLLPIYPLDGGQIMMAFAKNARGVRNTFYVSIACAILVGGLFLSEGSWFASIFFFYMGLVNFSAARAYERTF
ncbi:MAG: site-2 protease family protein [Thermoguttaceae bacterium]|nr:site-2 protease family protein [Thermoguttaceae bacterium]